MGPDMRIYSQGELYSGSTWGIVGYNKKGRPRYGHKPLDPGWVARSNEIYHPKPKPAPPKPAEQSKATQASVGQTVRRPSETRKRKRKTNLASFRIRKAADSAAPAFAGYGYGTGLNIG